MPAGNKNGSWFRLCEWLLFFLAWWFIVPILLMLAPIGMADYFWRESRLRRLYRHHLLDWNRKKEMILHKGTLIVEWRHESVDRLWWLPDDIRAKYPDCPLAPASVLEASFDLEERFRLLHNKAVKTWWESHLQEFCDHAHLVSAPSRVRRNPEELVAAPNAVVVSPSFTYRFYHWT